MDRVPCVIVTGSSGLIGTRLVERLVGDFHVLGFDTTPPDRSAALESAGPARFTFVETDLTSDDAVAQAVVAIGARPIASVIHLAAYYNFTGEESDLYEKITVRGSQRLFEALRPRQPEQFVFSSTMLVHQPPPADRLDEVITEETPIEATWDYPQSKVDVENWLHAKHGSIPIVLLRIAGVYDDYCHSIPLANQMRRIYEERVTSKVYPGDPKRGQSFVHLDDLIEAIVLTIRNRGTLPEETALLIGEPVTLGYGDLQKEFGRLIHGKDWPTTQVPKVLAKAVAWVQDNWPIGESEQFIKPWMIDRADDHYALDITRARRLLDWEPRHQLREALPKMVAALKADPAKWYEEHHLKLPAKMEEAAAEAER